MPPDASSRPEACLLLEQDMQAPRLLAFSQGTAAAFSRRCPGRDRPNEDGAALLPFGPRSGVLAVADGVGGHSAGGEASRVALGALAKAVARGEVEGRTLRESILNGFEQANRAVTELNVGAATTLVVAELSDGKVRSYHAGDSELLLMGQRGRVKHKTVSHSPVGYAVHAGMLDAQAAMVHEDRHLVSNTIGSPDMHIDVGPGVKVAPRDTLLLASDGLLDNLSGSAVIDMIRKGPLPQAAQELASAAQRRMLEVRDDRPGKPDDLTYLIWRPSAGFCAS